MLDKMQDAIYCAARDNLRATGWKMSQEAFDDLRLEAEANSFGLISTTQREKSEAMGLPIEITNEVVGWELLTQR